MKCCSKSSKSLKKQNGVLNLVLHLPNTDLGRTDFTNSLRLKKKSIRFSGHFLQKQMRQAGCFFFIFYFPPKQMRQLFFFNPVKFDLKFKCKQKWKERVICILPGLRLLRHAAGTNLGFMFRAGTGFMQQTLCNTQMLRHSSDTAEVCCQNNQS